MNLNQITIHSTDVVRATRFYQQLGLLLIVDASPRYVRFACPSGDSTFSISHTEQAFIDDTTLYFEVDDVDQTCEHLKHQGIRCDTAPEDQRWLWRESSLSDPDGHHLKIYAAGTNRKNPPWRVKPSRWFDALLESPVNLMK
jgi:catechol 2,3-dioxygenase-like lactoylglutathione lyase family enzyme